MSKPLPKFRAWHLEDKKMLPVQNLHWLGDRRINAGFPLGNILNLQNPFSNIVGEDVVLMEWTGYQDKDGKDIYDGDLVERSGEGYDTEVFKVIFGEFRDCCVGGDTWILEKAVPDGFSIYQPTVEYNKEYLTVVGNIYENPVEAPQATPNEETT